MTAPTDEAEARELVEAWFYGDTPDENSVLEGMIAAYGQRCRERGFREGRDAAAACGTCSVENGGDGHGTAWDVGPDGEPSGKPCPSCEGTGDIHGPRDLAKCPECLGTGAVEPSDSPCPACAPEGGTNG